MLNDANYCSWYMGTNPVPLAAASPPRVHVDARCNYPGSADPRMDPGATLYDAEREDPAFQVTRIPDGTEVTILCYASGGEDVRDNNGNNSSIWLNVQAEGARTGLLPDVNIGGGYTEQQLIELGLKRC